jgi:hypothetical protein
VTDEWKEYCHGPLAFEIPNYEPITIPTAPTETPAATTEATGAGNG